MAQTENRRVPDLTEPVHWYGLSEEFRDEKIITDPNGSYTGRPKDLSDRPVQDADDL